MSMFSRPTPEARGLGMTSQRARDRLIDRLKAHGIADRRVLDVMRRLPRHLFIQAQTISQPWVVARMTEALIEHKLPAKVLEVGTGSGYQAAVLASLLANVYTVERIEELLRNARRRFRKLGIENVRSKHDDGKLGWPEHAPFDAVMLTAAGEAVDASLFEQLAPDGVLVAPIGTPGLQRLLRYRHSDKGWVAESLGDVSFVPLLGGLG
jgi:protein-L-isoaspartate(D-aspartate) O-methyltransferase